MLGRKQNHAHLYGATSCDWSSQAYSFPSRTRRRYLRGNLKKKIKEEPNERISQNLVEHSDDKLQESSK